MKKADPGFREVIAAMPEPPQSRRSAVHVWLRKNSKHVEKQIADRAMDWATFAAALAKVGVTNKDGQAFSGAAVKQTWYRVRPAGGRPAKAAPAARPKPEAAQLARAIAAKALPSGIDDGEPGFTTASLKQHKDHPK